MVLETRASDSKEPSIRSSRWKRSLEGSPSVEEHEAMNLVTFEVRTTPFSRLSTWTIDPGRTLFINLFVIFQVSSQGRRRFVSSIKRGGRKNRGNFSTGGARGLHAEERRGDRDSGGGGDEGRGEEEVLTGTEHNHPSKHRKTTSVLDLLPWS